MSIGNSNLKNLSPTGIPGIERLYGGRYRVSRYFISLDKDRAFESEIEANYFEEFGSPDGAVPVGIPSGVESGEAFTNCKLVSEEITYFPNDPERRAVLIKVYETLTGTLVDEQEPVSGVGQDGGKTLDQTLVGDLTATFTGIVGVTTHPDDASLVLAGYDVQVVNGKKTVKVKWVEGPLLISESVRSVSEGVLQHDYVFKHAEGVTQGNVISRSTESPEGFKVIRVSTLSNSAGEVLTNGDGSAKLANRRTVETMFRIPGTVNIQTVRNRAKNGYYHVTTAPVETKVLSDVLVYYQTGDSVESTDYTLDGAVGAWNPSDWANAIALSPNDNRPYFTSQSMRGYTAYRQFPVSGFSESVNTIDGIVYITDISLSTTSVPVGSSNFAYTSSPYIYDRVNITYDLGGGVKRYVGLTVVKDTVFRIRASGGLWLFEMVDEYNGPSFSYTVGGSIESIISERNGSVSSISSPVTSAPTLIDSGVSSGVSPFDAAWSLIELGEEKSGQEEYASQGESVNGNIIWMGTYGYISVSGGPEWPLTKRYVLNVNIERAFEDLDTGTIIYQKTVQVATINPV